VLRHAPSAPDGGAHDRAGARMCAGRPPRGAAGGRTVGAGAPSSERVRGRGVWGARPQGRLPPARPRERLPPARRSRSCAPVLVGRSRPPVLVGRSRPPVLVGGYRAPAERVSSVYALDSIAVTSPTSKACPSTARTGCTS